MNYTCNMMSTRTPRSSSAKLLSSCLVLNLYWCVGLFLLRGRTLHLPLLSFMSFLSAHFFSLFRFLSMVAQPSGVSATPSSFVSSADLVRMRSDYDLKQYWFQYRSLGYLTSNWPPVQLCAADHNPRVHLSFSPSHYPFLLFLFHSLSKAVMSDFIKSLAEIKINDIYYSPLAHKTDAL